jgi:hypothetical protein
MKPIKQSRICEFRSGSRLHTVIVTVEKEGTNKVKGNIMALHMTITCLKTVQHLRSSGEGYGDVPEDGCEHHGSFRVPSMFLDQHQDGYRETNSYLTSHL